MKFTQIRNATILIEFSHGKIIVDPMLARKGSLPKLRYYKSDKRNPLVDLPEVFTENKDNIDYALITHCQKGHFDHLDRAGVRWLVKHQIPTFCTPRDEKFLDKKQNLDSSIGAKEKHLF
jgi:L-ascorbate metabolism protein UlaG (beta-lactamase superfamily)